MSNFYVYDASRVRIGKIQHDESIQWLENYQSPGEVKIVTRVTPDNLIFLVEGNRIYNTDSNTVAIIVHAEITEDEDKSTIVARAALTAMLLDDRVVMATENTKNVEQGMYQIYSRNRRDLSIGIGTPKGYTESIETQTTWNSVLDAEKKLAEVSGLGFLVQFDPETSGETFKVYKGVDRSIDGSENYVGYFGTDAGNIKKVEVVTGVSNYKNVAIVAGEDKGTSRVVRTVSLFNVSGDDRKELFVDAKDIQSQTQTAIDTGEKDKYGNPVYTYQTKTYTTAEYNALLDNRGYEKLAEHLPDLRVTCEIEQTNIKYGVDYFLGDRMPIKLTRYNIHASAIVSSVNLVYEASGKKIVATLSDFKLEVQ